MSTGILKPIMAGGLLLGALLPGGCRKPDVEELFTQLSIRAVMPDSRPVERLEIVHENSYLDNVNTYERVAFPDLEGNTATLRIRKGVYTFTVEARATYADGSVRLLRCADYNQIMQAATWVGDREQIALLLKSVN